jgi:hypothetical protein
VGASGIGRGFDKVEVSTDESREEVVSFHHGLDHLGEERKVMTGLEVDVEELERGMGVGERSVRTKLNETFGDWRKGQVLTSVEL